MATLTRNMKVILNLTTGAFELHIGNIVLPITTLEAHNLAISIHEAMKQAAEWDEHTFGNLT